MPGYSERGAAAGGPGARGRKSGVPHPARPIEAAALGGRLLAELLGYERQGGRVVILAGS